MSTIHHHFHSLQHLLNSVALILNESLRPLVLDFQSNWVTCLEMAIEGCEGVIVLECLLIVNDYDA